LLSAETPKSKNQQPFGVYWCLIAKSFVQLFPKAGGFSFAVLSTAKEKGIFFSATFATRAKRAVNFH
jgi:hypothetical protein